MTIMSEEYPEVDLSHMLVDTSGMELIRYPKQVRHVLVSELNSIYSVKTIILI